jgi:hypothetical protein
MHVSTTQVLRKFAQKMAAHNKQANPLAGIGAALSDPKTLGTIAGAGGLGLSAYGLARAMQSDEDRERGSWTPTLAGLAGVLGGGYAGSQLGPQLAEMLRKAPNEKALEGLRGDLTGSVNYTDAVNHVKSQNPFPAPKNVTPPSAAPKRISTPPQSKSELAAAQGYEAAGAEPDHIGSSPNFNRGYNRPNVSGVDAEEPG